MKLFFLTKQSGGLLAKATTTKMVTVPSYTRKDGRFVPSHQKLVHYDPNKEVHHVVSGQGSHSQKLAHKKLHAKFPGFKDLPVDEQFAHILSSATNIQNKASLGAAISGWKKAALAGHNPSPSQWKAFNTMDADKQAELIEEAKASTPDGKASHLKSPIVEQVTDEKGFMPSTDELQKLDGEDEEHISAKLKEWAGKMGGWGKLMTFLSKTREKVQGKTVESSSVESAAQAASAHSFVGSDSVISYYDSMAKKIAGMAASGDVAGLEAMVNPGNKSWQGKTKNSMKLLAIHADAVKIAKGKIEPSFSVIPGGIPHVKVADGWQAEGSGQVYGPGGAKFITLQYLSGDPVPPMETAKYSIGAKTTAMGFLVENGVSEQEALNYLYPPVGIDGAVDGGTKEIGGKTYGMKNGRWHLLGDDAESKDGFTPVPGQEYSGEYGIKYKNVDGVWLFKTPDDPYFHDVTDHSNIENLNNGIGFYGRDFKADTPSDVVQQEPVQASEGGPTNPWTDAEWAVLYLPDANTNAKSHNKKIDAMKAAADAGDIASIKAMKFGSNSYGKKQAKIAEHLVANMATVLATSGDSSQKTSAPTNDDDRWAMTYLDPGMSGASNIMLDDGSGGTYYAAWVDTDETWEVGYIDAEGQPSDDTLSISDPENVQEHLKNLGAKYTPSVKLINHLKIEDEDAFGKYKSDSAEDGPKEGDIKEGADGVLIFKNGRWHKQEDFALVSIKPTVDGWVSNVAAGKVPTKEQALAFAALSDDDQTDAQGEAISEMLSLDPDASDDVEYDKLVDQAANKIDSLHAQALGGGVASDPVDPLDPADPIAKSTAKQFQFVYQEGKSNKFWNVHVDGNKLVTSWGKIGTKGQTQVKELKSPIAAGLEMAAKMKEKVLKGYSHKASVDVEVDSSPEPAGVAGATMQAATKTAKVEEHFPHSGSGPKIKVIDNWNQVGPQAGSNAGGLFEDKTGKKWYCKFPGDPDVAKNEFLATKLYQMLGADVPSLQLVEKGGTLGIASKFVDGLKTGSAAALAAAPGAHEWFAVDAWLANWDVVGLSFDNMKLGKDGKVVRVDNGGALIYRAQGGKKGSAFGDEVMDLDSLLDAGKNPKTAAVFKGIKNADIMKGVHQLAKLKPSQISDLCQKVGPGDDKEQAALADKLIARRAHILKKYGVSDPWNKPKPDIENLKVNPADMPAPIDFVNFNGPGKGLSSKAWLNEQNSADSAALVAFAKKGNLRALKNYQYDMVDKETGAKKGKKSITDHPSNKVTQQWCDLVETLNSIAYPPVASLEMPSLGAAGSIEEISQDAGYFQPQEFVGSVHAEARMGFFMKLGSIEGVEDLVNEHKWGWLSSGSSFVSKAKEDFKKLGGAVKAYVSAVQASGWINHLWSQNKKETSTSGNGGSYSGGVYGLTHKIYQEATELPENIQVWRWMKDTTAGKSMMKQFLEAKPGLVIQNTDSMCTSYSQSWGNSPHFGTDVLMRIRCPKGSKGTLSFASGHFGSEHEITTLPGARFVIVSTKKGHPSNPNAVVVDAIMLPPHEGYVAELSALEKLGKAFVVFRRFA